MFKNRLIWLIYLGIIMDHNFTPIVILHFVFIFLLYLIKLICFLFIRLFRLVILFSVLLDVGSSYRGIDSSFLK